MFPPEKHRPLSGSQLFRIITCPGSFKLHQKYKSDDDEENQSVYASEGSMLHKAVEDYLRSAPIDALDVLLEPELPVTVKDSHGGVHSLTSDHKMAIEDCLEYLANVIKTCGPDWNILIEHQTSLDEYDPLLKMASSGGTCDIVLIDENNKTIHIIDWKFGKGIMVSAIDNHQLRSYALGTALSLMKDIDIDTYSYVTHIVQPRISNYSQEELSYDDLVNWVEYQVLPAIQKAYEKTPVYNPGTDQCRWCAAKYHCEARKALATEAAQAIFQAHSEIDGDLDDADLAKVLQQAKFYEGYISDLREYAYRKLNNGENVPGFKLVSGRSSRQWADIKAAEKWLMDNYEGDFLDLYETEFLTPPKAEKLDKKIRINDEFQELIVKIPGKPTLAEANDKRPALDMSVKAKFKEALGGE